MVDDDIAPVINDPLLIMVNKATIKIDWQLSAIDDRLGSTRPVQGTVAVRAADTIGHIHQAY